MQIQLRTDNNVAATAGLTDHVETTISTGLTRFSGDITGVEVHLGDENSAEKSGSDDKRCVIKALVSGYAPLVVTHHAPTVHQAIDGGLDRMKSLLERTLDRRKDHR